MQLFDALSALRHGLRFTAIAIAGLTVLATARSQPSVAPGGWTAKAPLPVARNEAAASRPIRSMTLRAIIADFLGGERYSLGFYASRGFTLFTSMLVLGLLLWETTSLYARLARSNAMLQRERDNKLMNLQAAVASISHEIKQPLAAIAMNGAAAQRFLELSPPILGEARSALNDLVRDSHRMGEILDNIHHLFGKGEREKEPIDMNEVVLAALRLLRGELTDHCVEAVVELASEPPHVKGHRVQLQESS